MNARTRSTRSTRLRALARALAARGSLLLGAGLAIIAVAIATARPRPAAPTACPSALAPDPQLVRYRHAIPDPGAAPPGPDLDADIAALAARSRARSLSPADLAELADLHLRRAKRTGDLEDYAAAEAAAQRSLVLMPSPNGAALTLAGIASARHDFRRAIELAGRAQARSAGALIALATAHLALGELAEASAAAEALVEEQPGTSTYGMRALVLQAQGRDAEAAFDFARGAAADEPGEVQEAARLRALWARFLLRRGELAGARLVVGEALRIAPGHPLALAQDGELLLRVGRARDAAARFEQAFAASRQVRYLIDQARAQELAGDRLGASETVPATEVSQSRSRSSSRSGGGSAVGSVRFTCAIAAVRPGASAARPYSMGGWLPKSNVPSAAVRRSSGGATPAWVSTCASVTTAPGTGAP